MASTRLTNNIRDSIISSVAKHAFAARCVKQMEAECAFAQEVYDHIMDTKMIYDGDYKRVSYRTMISRLPVSWRSRQTHFKVRFGSEDRKLDFYKGIDIPNHYQANLKMVGWSEVKSHDQENRDFMPGYNWGTLEVFDAGHVLSKKAQELTNAREDLLEEMSSARASARSTLNSVTTVQKLIVMWPEIEAFASPFLQEKKAAEALLPVIAREKLNDALGLPPGVPA